MNQIDRRELQIFIEKKERKIKQLDEIIDTYTEKINFYESNPGSNSKEMENLILEKKKYFRRREGIEREIEIKQRLSYY